MFGIVGASIVRIMTRVFFVAEILVKLEVEMQCRCDLPQAKKKHSTVRKSKGFTSPAEPSCPVSVASRFVLLPPGSTR